MSEPKATTPEGEEPIHVMDGLAVTACNRCPRLAESRSCILNGRGPENARIMFVADKPGQYDDQRKLTFSGDDGKLLGKLMNEVGIDPTEVFVTYLNRCWPLGNSEIKAPERRNCREHLDAELDTIKPAVIVTLGAKAFNALLPKHNFSDSIGQTIPFDGMLVIPTFAPGFLLRGNWGKIPLVQEHLFKAKQLAEGKRGAQPLEAAQANWIAVTDLPSLRALEILMRDMTVVTTDTETTGLNWLEDEILCVGFGGLDRFGKPLRMGFSVPILHRKTKNWKFPDDASPLVSFWAADEVDEAMAIIGRILGNDVPKAIQNSGFDIPLFERDCLVDTALRPDLVTAFGWTVNNFRYDPMLLQRLINENLPANEAVMLSMYTDMPWYEGEIREQSYGKTRMDLADDEVMWTYSSGDVDGLARLLPPMIRRANTLGVMWIHDNISIPMIKTVWAMTRRGIPVDMPYFRKLAARYAVIVAEAKQAVFDTSGLDHEFNINSSPQLQKVLFGELKIPRSGRKTKGAKACQLCTTDEPCEKHDQTSKDALYDSMALMRAKGKEPHPILEAVLTYKELVKRKGTYIDGNDGEKGLMRFIRSDMKVHPTFKVGRADTGRLSAVDPPIQTIPKKVNDEVLGESDSMRRMFIAPPGFTLMEADWSQGEVWVMAYESGDQKLLDLLLTGQDVHTFVARKLCSLGISRVFPKDAEEPELNDYEWKKKYDTLRTKAKVFVFGLDYGMTEVGAAQRLGCAAEEAVILIDAFLSVVFPGLEENFTRVRREMEATGVLVNAFGRRGNFGDFAFMRSFGFKGTADIEAQFRKGVNMPIQSGLSDLHQIVHPLLEDDPVLKKRISLINAVHDSVAGLCPGEPEEAQESLVQTAWMIKERAERTAKEFILPNGKPLGWAIPMEIQWGKSWGHFDWTLTSSGELIEPKEQVT